MGAADMLFGSKADKLARQTGFEGDYHRGKPSADGGTSKYRSKDEYEKARDAHINNNYHIQSAIDHGRATGNKRADKLSKELKSEEDFAKAYKYMKKGHEHGGNGGNFSSLGDMMASQDYRFDKNMDALYSAANSGGGGGGGDGNGDPGPEETSDPLETSDRHDELANTSNTYPGLTNAQDSYNSAFNQATEAGRDMESGDYLRQRADDKREWVTDKYMPYLQTKNELARHESNYAAKNAIHEMQDLEIADYTDPMDWYNKMKDDLEDVG